MYVYEPGLRALALATLAIVLFGGYRAGAAPNPRPAVAGGGWQWPPPRDSPTPSTNADGDDTITQGGGSKASCVLAADVAHIAQQMCGNTAIEEALRSMHVRSGTTKEIAQILGGLGFDATLDLQLLGQGGGSEVEELMAELKASRVSIGDRGKIRLLLKSSSSAAQPAAHFNVAAQPAAGSPPRQSGGPTGPHVAGEEIFASIDKVSEAQDVNEIQHRLLQDAAGAENSQSMSMDTIAIALSVLFATAGYLLQCASNPRHTLTFTHPLGADVELRVSQGIHCSTRRAELTGTSPRGPHRRAGTEPVSLASRGHLLRRSPLPLAATCFNGVAMMESLKVLCLFYADCRRQHEQLLAQITRTDQWIDRCCRPIRLARRQIKNCVPLSLMVAELEASHTEIFAEMLAASSVLFPVGVDGLVRSARSGRVLWDEPLASNFTCTVGNIWAMQPSAAVCSIVTAFGNLNLRQPYGMELPAQMVQLIEAEPTGAIACRWRRAVEAALLPALSRIVDLLQEFSATIEW